MKLLAAIKDFLLRERTLGKRPRPTPRQRRRARQRGVALVAVMIAMAITLVIRSWFARAPGRGSSLV